MAAKRAGIVSLGCPRNLVDSESIAAGLRSKGYCISEVAGSEIAVINTCAFIEDAKKESIDAILAAIALKKEGKLRKVIVAGCLAQRYGKELAREFPEVDAFVGKIGLAQTLEKGERLTPLHFGYLKICEGCLHRCSFCAIPSIKGKFESAPIPLLVRKAQEFDRAGVRELNVIGQDISGFGVDLYAGRKLPLLVKKLLKACPHVGWFRLLYLYPGRAVEEILPILKDEPRLCKYIDIPVQHASGRVLKAMNRGYTPAYVRRLIEKVRKELPEAALRTSVIVGFPGETARDFKELLDFITWARFERLGAFIYSREEGTPAYAFKGQVPRKTRERRFDAVMSLQQGIAAQVNKRFLGQKMRVLVEEEKDGSYLGRTQYDAPEVDGTVYVKSALPLKTGDFVDTTIVDTLEYDLVAEATGRENE